MRAKICHLNSQDCAQNIIRREVGEEYVPEMLAPGQKSIAQRIINIVHGPARRAERNRKIAELLTMCGIVNKEIDIEIEREQKRQARIEYLLGRGPKPQE